MYKINKQGTIFFNNSVIPKDETNTDYLQYKEWLSKGNQPEFIQEVQQEQTQVIQKVQEVTMRQARLTLLEYGLLDQVQAYVNTLDTAAKIEWEYGSTVRRDNPLILAFIGNGFTQEQMDELFVVASRK
jgi:hypothetical protein